MANLFVDKKGNVWLKVEGESVPLNVPSSTKGNVLKTRLGMAKKRLTDAQKTEVDKLLEKPESVLEGMVAGKKAIAGGVVPRKAEKTPAPKPKVVMFESQRKLLELAAQSANKRRIEALRAALAAAQKATPAPRGGATLVIRNGEVFLFVPGRNPYPMRVPATADADRIREALRSLYNKIEQRLPYRNRIEVDALLKKPADELKRMVAGQAKPTQEKIAGAPATQPVVPPVKLAKIDDGLIKRAISGNEDAIKALAANRAGLDKFLSNQNNRKRISNLMFGRVRDVLKAKDAQAEGGINFESEFLPAIPPALRNDAMRLGIESLESLAKLPPDGHALVTRVFLFKLMFESKLESDVVFKKEASKLRPPGALVSAEPMDAHLLIIAALYLRRWNARASAKPLAELDLSKVAAAPSTQVTAVAAPEKGKKPVPTVVAPQPKIQIAEEDAMIKALETCANAKAGPAATKPADESLSMLFKMSVKLDQYLRENPERSTLVLFNLALDIEKKLPPAYSFTQYLKGLLKSQPKDFRELLIDPYEKKGGKLDENAGSKAFAYARVALRSYFLIVKLLSNELLIEMEHLGEMKANRLELKPADVLRLGLLARRGVLLNSGMDDIKIPRWEPSKPAQKEAPKPGDDVIFQYPLRQKQ